MSELTVKIPIGMGIESYATFMRCKTLPRYEVRGRDVWTDRQSHSSVFGARVDDAPEISAPYLFDYQRWVTERALSHERYGAFLDCGLGKTAIIAAWAHAVAVFGRVLVLCPLAVMEDIQRFCHEYHGHRLIDLRRGEMWTDGIAILNWESPKPIDMRGVAGIVLDEASILKNGQGKTRKRLTAMASGVKYRLACSATPSPNDHAEYATQAVWLGHASTTNEFYGRWFRKDGTSWRLKRHAVDPFYRALRTWCCYIQKPSELGFDGRAEMTSEPDYRIIDTTCSGFRPDGQLFSTSVSLGESRRIFGALRSDRSQPRFADSCRAVNGDRAIVWCARNAEQDAFARDLGGHSISGTTPVERRVEMIDEFRAGRVSVLVSKPQVLGFGVNIPEAESMLYSGYTWSFEQFYQAVRRSHRFGRVGRLKVHVPVTDEERPVWDSLRKKMASFDRDVAALQAAMVG